MTITLEEKEARRKARRAVHREAELKNRVNTNLKQHIHPVIEAMAEETRVSKNTMIRILILEALVARGVDLDKTFREWKARQNGKE